MTVAQAALALGVSKGTLYRYIRIGKVKARKVGRRWDVDVDQPPAAAASQPAAAAPAPKPKPATWPWYVDRVSAEKDGRRPEDFQFEQWPMSDLVLTGIWSGSSRPPFVVECRIPADTPRANRYDAQGNKHPDPVGMALSWIEIFLIDENDGTELAVQNTEHDDSGRARAYMGRRNDKVLWQRLTPGTSIRARFRARSKFYFLNEEGGAELGYAKMGQRGYFVGEWAESPVYTLSMDAEGSLSMEPAP